MNAYVALQLGLCKAGSAFQHDTPVGSQESVCNNKISGMVQVRISNHTEASLIWLKVIQTNRNQTNFTQSPIIFNTHAGTRDGVWEKLVSGT